VLYPITFQPIFKERVWGGRNLETLYHKPLPPGISIGESWEISDRPDEASVVLNGEYAGKDLRWLMEHQQGDLLGDARSQNGRFPLLVKILDAQEKLSLQVHPPANKAAGLGGEPKTEMWYVAHAATGAELYVGLKPGIVREEFERRIQTGTVAECFHRVTVKSGDVMFLPSGRVHAIGAGLVIFEIQQNSDTTYRVYDWDRSGTDGKPRELHIPQSLASIDFRDYEPALIDSPFFTSGLFRIRSLVRNPLFRTDVFRALSRDTIKFTQSRLRIIGVLEKKVVVGNGANSLELKPGQFGLIPASLKAVELRAEPDARFLLTEPGE
jgi:mannose-6-phosphate isomerase